MWYYYKFIQIKNHIFIQNKNKNIESRACIKDFINGMVVN